MGDATVICSSPHYLIECFLQTPLRLPCCSPDLKEEEIAWHRGGAEGSNYRSLLSQVITSEGIKERAGEENPGSMATDFEKAEKEAGKGLYATMRAIGELGS